MPQTGRSAHAAFRELRSCQVRPSQHRAALGSSQARMKLVVFVFGYDLARQPNSTQSFGEHHVSAGALRRRARDVNRARKESASRSIAVVECASQATFSILV